MVYGVDRTIKVSEETYSVLKSLKEKLELRSFDAVIRILIRAVTEKENKIVEISKEILKEIIEQQQKKEKEKEL